MAADCWRQSVFRTEATHPRHKTCWPIHKLEQIEVPAHVLHGDHATSVQYLLFDEQNFLIEAVALEFVTLIMREWPRIDCHQIVTKMRPKQSKISKLKKTATCAN